MLLSKKKLFQTLDDIYEVDAFTEAQLSHHMIGNETFGRKSCIYVNTNSPEEKMVVQRELIINDFAVNEKYGRGTNRIEVQVSYFKGWHHAE